MSRAEDKNLKLNLKIDSLLKCQCWQVVTNTHMYMWNLFNVSFKKRNCKLKKNKIFLKTGHLKVDGRVKEAVCLTFFIFYFLTNRFEFYGAVRPFFTFLISRSDFDVSCDVQLFRPAVTWNVY